MHYTSLRKRRGRPRQEKAVIDHGTAELQQKRRQGMTQEALDLCRDYHWITTGQHWAGNHFRWLHGMRFGIADVKPMDYERQYGRALPPAKDEHKHAYYEKEFQVVSSLLQQHRCYDLIARLCVYRQRPHFLHYTLTLAEERTSRVQDSVLAVMPVGSPAYQELTAIQDGLTLLCDHWKVPV